MVKLTLVRDTRVDCPSDYHTLIRVKIHKDVAKVIAEPEVNIGLVRLEIKNAISKLNNQEAVY